MITDDEVRTWMRGNSKVGIMSIVEEFIDTEEEEHTNLGECLKRESLNRLAKNITLDKAYELEKKYCS